MVQMMLPNKSDTILLIHILTLLIVILEVIHLNSFFDK